MAKKVLIVRSTPNDQDPNSYNVQQIGLGKAFCRLGYDYDFVTFKVKDQTEKVFYEYDGCRAKYMEMPRHRFMRWGFNFQVMNEQFLKQYDLIIVQEYYQIQTYIISRRSDKVALYSGPYYSLFIIKAFSPIYDFFFTKSINKNINYKFVKSVLAQKYLEDKGYTNVHTIGVGLDTERFDNEKSILPPTQELVDYMSSNRCILYVGTLCDRKNYPFMLKVYEKILETHPDVKFVMIGKSKVGFFSKLLGKPDSSYIETINKKVPRKVLDGIKFIERIDNPQLKFIYPLAKAFLLPSKLEIFGMVLLEAMYLGTPVITSYNGGSLTLIRDNDSGQMIPEFNIDKWAEAAIRYLDNPEYTAKVTKQASRRVKEEFNWDVIAKKFITAME